MADDLEQLAAWYETHSTASRGAPGGWVEVEDDDDPAVVRSARVPRSVATRLQELATATGREVSEVAGELIVMALGLGLADTATSGSERARTSVPFDASPPHTADMDSGPHTPHADAPSVDDAQRKLEALAATQALGGGIDDDPDECPALLAEARRQRSILDQQALPSAQQSDRNTGQTLTHEGDGA